MIQIGCTGFQEHTSLNKKAKVSLYEYAQYFPIVELDTSFYFIPQRAHIEKWLKETPSNFQFIMKVPGALTTHQTLEEGETYAELAQQLSERCALFKEQQRLYCLLAQFPASFTCTKQNVQWLRELRHWFKKERVAVEFRHSSWYDEKNRAAMRQFMTDQQFSLVIVDEPKKLSTTIPLDDYVTNAAFCFIRLHGRNDAGWMHTGPDARAYRTLYDYSLAELTEIQRVITNCEQQSQQVAIIFNNNSGGHAAANAQQLQQLLGLEFSNLNPTQLDLF